MEWVQRDANGGELGVGDFDALGVFVLVQLSADLEAGVGGGSGDQLDNGAVAAQGLAPPIDGNEREEAVLDLVPLCAAETYERRSNDLTIIWKLFER